MGRSPQCSKDGLNKGAWTASEDQILLDYVKVYGEGKWSNVVKRTGSFSIIKMFDCICNNLQSLMFEI